MSDEASASQSADDASEVPGRRGTPGHRWSTAVVIGVALLLVGCAESADPGDCRVVARTETQAGGSPFRLPLDTFVEPLRNADFQQHGGSYSDGTFHAAEDYYAPAGTPVYAMADGEVSFSGPMGGYGWLVIVDHAWANLYSLYGHLSPSRWSIGGGEVEQGELLGYLGDEWENGGSRERPLVAHLHLGVRAGQRTDYPGRGEWRWMAGWIKPCPTDLGWLQPSQIIASQVVPEGGFSVPEGSLMDRWLSELVLTGLLVLTVATWIVMGARKRNWVLPAIAALGAFVASRFLEHRGFVLVPRGLSVFGAFAAIATGVIAYRIRRQA